MNLPGASANTISIYPQSLKLTTLSKGWQQMESCMWSETILQAQSWPLRLLIISFSVFNMEGSNKRAEEEAIALNFTHYLKDVEGLITTSNVCRDM